MLKQVNWRIAGVVAVATALFLASQNALAAGRFNLPTSLPQCLGIGYGAGYHAPLMLGPVMNAGTESQRVQRLPTTPQRTGFSAPSTLAFPAPPSWQGSPRDAGVAYPGFEPTPRYQGLPMPRSDY